MFFTEMRLIKKKYRGKIIVFVVIYSMTMLVGCSQSNIEAPYRGWKIWGFHNKEEERSNTFTSNSPEIADISTYSYYDESSFLNLIKSGFHKQFKEIYQLDYQEEVRQQLEKMIKNNTYSFNYPLFIQNPFGTNASGLYVYMGSTTDRIHLYYTITTQDETIPDFSETMYIDQTVSEAVEGQIVGLIPGQYNKVIIELRDASGNQISKKAYLLNVPKIEEVLPERVDVLQSEGKGNRGLFNLLSYNQEGTGYYLFYDNNGIVRSQIPTDVTDFTAKVLQIGNQLFFESSNNTFALLDNLGEVIEIYEYTDTLELIDYDYDPENHKVLFLAKNLQGIEENHIVQLELLTNVWETCLEFKNLIKDKEKLLLCSIQVVDGKDVIICSKALASIFRINNIYTRPVIRWVISEEGQLKKSSYQSLLLFETGEKTHKYSLDSVNYIYSKGLSKGQFYLSLIDYNLKETLRNRISQEVTYFRKYMIDENQNRFRLIQQIEFSQHIDNCSALVHGTHIIIGLGDEQEIVEYNEKGEIMLRMRFPNKNSSNNIYKYTMDRYWF